MRILTLFLAFLTPSIALAQLAETNPALNPLPETSFVAEPPVPYDSEAWSTDHDLLIPGPFLWERGGWAWNEETRDWRLGDQRLRWPTSWPKAADWGTPPKRETRQNIVGDAIVYTDFSHWLPADPRLQCDGILALQVALKVHRITLLTHEVDSLTSLRNTVCVR